MNVEMATLCQDMQLQVKQAKRVFFRIMLGHEQYSGYIQKIRNFLTSGVETKVKERRGRPYPI